MASREFDSSWILNILITDRNVERSIRVRSDLHIGGVMLKLVESIDSKDQIDWSDHSFYWSEKSLWLTRNKTTLEQYGVQADAKLWFTPMHKYIQIQLPDLRAPIFKVNFSINVFSVVIRLCRELGIRHPEELSLLKKLEAYDLKHNQGISGTRSSNKLPTGMHAPNMDASNPSLDEIRTPGSADGLLTPEGTLSRGLLTAHLSPLHPFNANGLQTPGSMDSLDFDLSGSHPDSIPILPNLQPKAKNLVEMARLNSAWLDSSRSLMEQDVKDDDVILLRLKFLDFYDLNTKHDQIRIHYIFEQAKCSIISEELFCSEDEMIMFAALQAQIEKQKTNFGYKSKEPELSKDEIDSALCDLQISLEGHAEENIKNLTQTPQLKNWMKCCRPRKFHLKTFKKYWFVLREQHFTIFNSDLEGEDNMLHEFDLSGSEGFSMSTLCSIPSRKFLIKLFLERNKAPIELWLRPDHEEQYVEWLTALRLVQQGKTMADTKSFEGEKRSIESLLEMQRESETCDQSPNFDPTELKPEQMFASRFLSKSKMKQLLQRTINANSNMKQMSKMEAQLNYIKAWQMLPSYGFKYFIINVKNSKKEELLGIGTDRLVKMDIKKGDILKTWMYKTIKTWSVNWEFKQVQVSFEEEAELAFQCLTAGCKVIHEFIGGYIFLSMRSGDKSQTLNDELFHKLTGGWV